PDPEISKQYAVLLTRAHLGSQYDWLSRYARQAGIDDLELSIHKDDRAEAFLRDHVERVSTPIGESWQLASTDDSHLEIFRPFRFPILDLTKVDMQNRAREHGFLDILEESWFCYLPIRGEAC